MRRGVLAALALLGCRAACADPAPAPAATGSPWRTLSPGVRWRESLARFTDERGQLRESVWVVARVDLSRTSLGIIRSPNGRPDGAAAMRDVVLAIDAGFFEPDHSPSGLVVSGAATLAPLGPRGGSGVLVVRDGRAQLLARESLDGGAPWAGAALAVQCGPRLIEPDGRVGIHRDDGHRFARTVACLRDGGRTLDLIATWQRDAPLRGPGLYELARALAAAAPDGAPGCEAALNLDGGPSTGVFARAADRRWRYAHDPVGPTPWLLVARR